MTLYIRTQRHENCVEYFQSTKWKHSLHLSPATSSFLPSPSSNFYPPLLTLYPIPALTIYPPPFPTPAHPVSTFNFHIIGTRFVSERHHNTQPLKIIEDWRKGGGWRRAGWKCLIIQRQGQREHFESRSMWNAKRNKGNEIYNEF